jgi:hypothetical protein
MPTSAAWNGRLVMMSLATGEGTEEGDATAVGEETGGEESGGLAVGAEALASGGLGVWLLVTAEHPVATISSPATRVARTTPILTLPGPTSFAAQSVLAAEEIRSELAINSCRDA